MGVGGMKKAGLHLETGFGESPDGFLRPMETLLKR